ncbi:MAG: alpha-L-arabinofuranosidase C-terminal domain-containing protein [Massilibacteroides sp.]|nr:alpha-L-arabinofuranosidase C-terminal domain-containing protein [Massilibacteroides sp.]MDD3061666.1 alpha-L-arabinofuranosidase C-terminal domain-containing protein [Massilibacteroides sp.]MDD4114291.1 alpha-L-arabinofuranosidase C-terminal domain-containing protein [Massilibacteroides sp.]MDD4660289.1 alpha-L-arabinofuranosidase C-terminal domain-containing protein [Massilibacteroides sp.]
MCSFLQAQNSTYELQVDVKALGASIQPSMYGIFFEDINFGADGGLYAELIKNRSFEFDNPFAGWVPFGDVTIETKNPCFDRNSHYVRLKNRHLITGTGLDNEGFRGIGVKAGEKYDFTVYARTINIKDTPVKIRVELVNAENNIFETQRIEIAGTDWKKYAVALSPKATEVKARLRITMETPGTIDLEHISLFPQKTFMNRPNGMREDLAQALKALKPGVFRFPGGCIVEGTTIETRYQWKNTVGPVENRPININRWNYTFPHKKFPDYYQSYGLGFYEYFLLSEDLGAEPLPVLNCGLSCQFENEGMDQHVLVKDLQPYVDDALDLIEFANGPVTSKWGRLRAQMGHPESFHLKFIAIGNEQWGPIYPERLKVFVDAIREKYPEIKIVGGSGPGSEGEDFDYLWPEMRRLGVDLVDEHFYRSPEWFLREAARYDSYDRSGPKVFAGEYACHPDNRENSFLTALCEAAFMTGLERNADVVHLATYAPLFAHVEAWQWRPDLIWFDNLRYVCTPNYYVQQLYSLNSGTHVLSLSLDGKPLTGQHDLYATAAFDQKTNELILKIANVSIQKKRIQLFVAGLEERKHAGTCTLLQSMDLEIKNTLEQPTQIVPRVVPVEMGNSTLKTTLLPFSFSVYRISL